MRAQSYLALSMASLLALAGCSGEQSGSGANNNSGSSGGSGSGDGGREAGREAAVEPEPTPVATPDAATARSDAAVAATAADAGPEAGDEDEATARRVAAPPARPALNSGARDRLREGLTAAQRGDLPAARTAFDAALAADSHAYQAAYNAGIIAERQGQDAQADAQYQRALLIQPDFELALTARARLLTRTGRSSEALALAQGVATRFPGNLAVRAEYARQLTGQNQYDRAIAEGREILRIDERNVGAKLAIAEAYRAQGRRDLALYIVNDVIHGAGEESAPDNGPGVSDPRAYYLRGLLMIEVEHSVPRAIVAFTRAAELDPQFAEAHNNLGVYLVQAGNSASAIEHLRAAVALAPTWARAHLNLGDALRTTREFDQAQAELQRALQLDGTINEVHYNLGRLYSEQAREVPSTGVENLTRRAALVLQAQGEYTRFRDQLGSGFAQHPRAGDVEAELGRLTTLATRTQTALERARRAASRTGNQPAGGGDGGAARAPAGDAGAADGGAR